MHCLIMVVNESLMNPFAFGMEFSEEYDRNGRFPQFFKSNK